MLEGGDGMRCCTLAVPEMLRQTAADGMCDLNSSSYTWTLMFITIEHLARTLVTQCFRGSPNKALTSFLLRNSGFLSACRIINSSHFQFSYANQSPCCFLPCQVLASFMISHLFTHCYFTNSQRDKTHVQYFFFSGYTCKLTFTQVLMNTVRFCRIQVIKSMPSPPISI